jgi:hypothetical protein
MNDVERLHEMLVGRFPDLQVEIDPPDVASGPWFVNVFRPETSPLVVEWRSARGFGVSTPGSDDYGSGVSEAFTNAVATFARVVQLVLSGVPASVPLGVRLMEIRQSRGVTQAGLASVLGTSQVNVSKAERRPDMQISTLGRHVAAMGGRLVLRAEFPDGRVEELPSPIEVRSITSPPQSSSAGAVHGFEMMREKKSGIVVHVEQETDTITRGGIRKSTITPKPAPSMKRLPRKIGGHRRPSKKG